MTQNRILLILLLPFIFTIAVTRRTYTFLGYAIPAEWDGVKRIWRKA